MFSKLAGSLRKSNLPLDTWDPSMMRGFFKFEGLGSAHKGNYMNQGSTEKKKNIKIQGVVEVEDLLGVWPLDISVYQWQGLKRVKRCFGNPFWPEGAVPRDRGVAALVCLYLLTCLMFQARLWERSEAHAAKRREGSLTLRVLISGLPVNHH